jgi:hypothetical protein
MWVDGVHFNIRLEEDRLCCLVIVGVRPDGTKELVALADGYRESTDSVASPPRCSPSATGPSGSAAPCVKYSPRRASNVAGYTARPTFSTPCRRGSMMTPKEALAQIYGAPLRTGPLEAVKVFADTFAPFEKATAKITEDLDVLLAFFDFPLEHWVHLRTTNPIESIFSTVRLRTEVTRGAGSRKAGLAMAYKLLDAAKARWRRINGHELLVPLVRAGATFIDGKLQERSDESIETQENKGSVAA